MPVNPWLKEKLKGLRSPPTIEVIAELADPALLDRLRAIPGVIVGKGAFNMVRLTVPPGLVALIGALPGVTVHYNAPVGIRSPLRFPGFPVLPDPPSILDPLMGEFKLSSIVIPYSPKQMAASFGPRLGVGVATFPFRLANQFFGLRSPLGAIQEPGVIIQPTGEILSLLELPEDNVVRNVKVAILDTGLTPLHPQLDPRTKGFLTLGTFAGPVPFDGLGHGQFVATEAFGGEAWTRFGLCKGVADVRNGNIGSWKVMNDLGFGETFALVQGIEAAVKWGAQVINLSLGGELQGCLLGTESVYTPLGPVPIRDIQVDSRVYAGDGSVQQVSHVWNHRWAPVLRIATARKVLTATPEHRFAVWERVRYRQAGSWCYKKGVVWKRAAELRKGELLLLFRPPVSPGHQLHINPSGKKGGRGLPATFTLPRLSPLARPNVFHIPNYSTSDLMWLVGLFIGDGSIGEHGCVVFDIPEADRSRGALVDTLRRFGCKARATIKRVYAPKRLGQLFASLDIKGNAHTKRLPQWVFVLPVTQRLALLAGILDADGCNRLNGYSLTLCNRQLVVDVKNLADFMGLETSKVWDVKGSGFGKGTELFRLNIYTEDVTIDRWHRRSLSRHLHMVPLQHVSSRRGRFASFRPHLPPGMYLERVVSIGARSALSVPVYDLTIGGQPSYVANGLVVHNSVEDDPLCRVIKALKDRVIVVCAAGNDGPGEYTIGTPAASPYALTVGGWSTYYKGVPFFSSRGPNAAYYRDRGGALSEGMTKPDCIAPSGGPVNDGDPMDLLYSGMTGWAEGAYDLSPFDLFGALRGTSQAAPLAAGVVALAMEKGYVRTAADVKAKLARHGRKDHVRGYGLITYKKLV